MAQPQPKAETEAQAAERHHRENLTANVLLGLLAAQRPDYNYQNKEDAIKEAVEYVALLREACK